MTGNNKFPLFPLFLRDNKKLKISYGNNRYRYATA